jgi:hypothetical protein
MPKGHLKASPGCATFVNFPKVVITALSV